MQNQYDVLIAGGGPAGLSAAGAAAAAGLRVALFERSPEIGYPIHTSGGSWIRELQQLGIPQRFMHPIHTGRFLAPASEAVFTYTEPVSCILDVRGLYQHLAVTAAAAGAHVFPASTVTGVLLRRGVVSGLAVRARGEYRAPVVIDATGVAGVLARQVGLRTQFQRHGVGAEVDLVLPEWPQDTAALLFGSLAGPAGYGWIFPHGEQRARVGIGVIHPDTANDPRQLLQALLIRGLPDMRREQSLPAAVEYHTGVVPSVPPLARTVTHGLLVVGDAGGLISTLLGEGIRFAIELGRLAGEVAAAAHRAGRFDAGFLRRYERVWRTRHGRLFQWAARLNRRLARYDDHAWNASIRLLAQLPPAAVPLLLKGEWRNRTLWQALWRHRRHLHPGWWLSRAV